MGQGLCNGLSPLMEGSMCRNREKKGKELQNNLGVHSEQKYYTESIQIYEKNGQIWIVPEGQNLLIVYYKEIRMTDIDTMIGVWGLMGWGEDHYFFTIIIILFYYFVGEEIEERHAGASPYL